MRIPPHRLIYGLATMAFANALLSADTKAQFTLPGGAQVTIIEAPFDKSKAKIVGCSAQTNQCSIDDLPPFGNDLEIPETYVKKITISIGGRTYQLDASNMYNAWGERPATGYFGGRFHDPKNCEVWGLFSDGAGAFAAVWEIRDGRVFRTVLTNDEEIFSIIDKWINPEKQTPE